MTTVEEALKIILFNTKTLPLEAVYFTSALDRVLAEDIFSDIDIPHFNNSAMDGFAVIAQNTLSTTKENGVSFEIIDHVKAGSISKKNLTDGKAIKIMTGAMVPEGADAVVMVENTETRGDIVKILKGVVVNENVRFAGESVEMGELVMEKGTVLSPAHIGMLASLGISNIKVSKKPRVAILATGDELVDVEDELARGKIRNSNTYALCAQIEKCGAIAVDKGIVKDDIVEIENRIKECFDCDIILISGGVSAGDYDFVKDVLERKLKADIKFWKVAMKPGKPVLFGLIKESLIFGLPGNPVSSMVNVELFVKSAILKMLGCNNEAALEVDAVLDEDIRKKNKRMNFIRAITTWENGRYLTKSTGSQGSGILKSMMLANSLICLAADDEYIEKGTKVRVRFLWQR